MKNKMLKNIKSVISSILVLLVVLLNFSFVPATQAVGTPTLTIGSQAASNGATINVPINATNFANSVGSMDFKVHYDAALLSYTGLTQNTISGHGTLINSDPGANPVIINWSSPVSALDIDNGTILTLNFTVISATTTNTNLTFTDTELGTVSNIINPSSFVPGVITLNPAKAITAFSFADPSATGSVNEGAKTVAITVPYGTDVTTLVPTITVSAGASVSPLSGVSNNFTDSQTYTVTGADSLTQAYVVTVTPAAPSTIATVTSGTYTANDTDSTITDIPYGTTSSAFQNALTKGESHQTWDPTDLSNPVLTGDTLVVTAQSGATKTYTLTVALNPAKNITSFSFAEGAGVITGTNIAVTVPYGTSKTALIASFTTTGASVTVNDLAQVSGITANDFTSPVTYKVTAADGTIQNYIVTVSVSANPDIALLATDKDALVDNSIKGANTDLSNITGSLTNPLPSTGTINGSTITWASSNPDIVSNNGQTVVRPAFVASNATVTLTATLTKGGLTDTKIFTLVVLKLPVSVIATVTSGTYIVSAGGTATETIINVPFGISKTTFLAALTKGESNQVWDSAGIADTVVTGNTLVVTAQDGTTKVTYTITTSDNPDIALVTADREALVDSLIKGENNADLSNITVALATLPAVGSVNGSTITWASSNEAVVSSDGQTINRPAFADGNTTITLTATLTKGAITQTKAFTLIVLKLAASTTATVTSGTYTVNDTDSTITGVPYGTTSSTFLAGLDKSESHQTWNSSNLSNPVITGNTLVITAQDGSTTKTYTLTVALNPAKEITAFSFPEGTGVINETNHTISVNVPFGTDVTTLTSTISITSGASVSPLSGVAQDFTSPLIYTVTAADGSTQIYTVTVKVLAGTQVSPNGSGDVTINSTTPEVVITNPTQSVDITISSGTTAPTIDVSSFITGGTGTLPAITIDSSVADVTIPAATLVTGPVTWDGVIQAPISGTPSGGNAPAGFSVGSTVISVGSPDGTLVFDKAVTLILPGVTGTVGYRPAGSNTWQTITTCAGSYTTPTAPTAPGECSINNGTDTKIVTYHFTSFAGLNVVSSGGGNNGGGGGGGGGGGYVPPINTSASTGQVLGASTGPTIIAGCDSRTTGFSVTTGNSCVGNTTTTTSTVIEGCDNRTTGFSTTSGQSCVGNIGITTSLVGQVLGVETTTYNFGTTTLKNGSKGEAVKELQRFLNDKLNLGLVLDGKLGPKTITVIKKWQKDNGLVADGLIGAKTKAMMLSLTS